jgi:hypothetical protein
MAKVIDIRPARLKKLWDTDPKAGNRYALKFARERDAELAALIERASDAVTREALEKIRAEHTADVAAYKAAMKKLARVKELQRKRAGKKKPKTQQ